ncbi:glucosaminidase domain-containing protein [Chitinophaga nivalis]|uniref:Glucosaminidase domain-containing protein n=1 Tax=Chitinophaga nivalis TaxID=2991709 RepID=A0ABT3IIN2_9BACT|nr:glucosaminidase domain-containing protein [Chitinophaga nivalis]MCW3466486.1 glucosaminidase domain-containing protein [Chitinophaga nivalis]MCW3483823.1 glucosaminidase domain-containing protein [Chitinophaga nivalis]
MKNAYPELPVVPYMKTAVEMGAVVSFLKAVDFPVAVKRAAYCFFRIESGNGKSGVNNNYAGIQADGARWPAVYDDLIVATSEKKENGTGKLRRFVGFNSWQDSLRFTLRNSQRRGLYVGGHTSHITEMDVRTPTDLCIAYKREWVTGNSGYQPNYTMEVKPFLSIYTQAVTLFPE